MAPSVFLSILTVDKLIRLLDLVFKSPPRGWLIVVWSGTVGREIPWILWLFDPVWALRCRGDDFRLIF